MKLYVTGPMTGIEDMNFPAFREAAKRLREAGYEVMDPADNGAGEPGMTWADYVRRDLQDMLTCDALAVLPGWKNSKGACLEVHIALELGWEVHDFHYWLR